MHLKMAVNIFDVLKSPKSALINPQTLTLLLIGSQLMHRLDKNRANWEGEGWIFPNACFLNKSIPTKAISRHTFHIQLL